MSRSVFLLCVVLGACSSDPERPPATSSGGPSSGGASTDGGSTSSSSSGGVDGGTNPGASIATGLRASIDNGARDFSDGPKATIQRSGMDVQASGKDSFGNELRVTAIRGVGLLEPGTYVCVGGSSGPAGATIEYTVTGGVATWTAINAGDCTITILSVENKVGGVVVGTFSGTARRGGSTEYLITKGEFRLTLE
jgi:hypothetical protein